MYKNLLINLINNGYNFQRMDDYLISKRSDKIVVLRHDVDKLPSSSLKIAKIEHSMGIAGTYYFRIVPYSYNLEIMQEIHNLGHEIGYHYEDVDLSHKKIKSNNFIEEELVDLSYSSFLKNINRFRKYFSIKTICMHGSPLLKYDNKMIWDKYNYKDLDIIGEPYFDVDYNHVAYFTDTGRRWNGGNVSIRDKVNTKLKYNYKKTNEIIDNISSLPKEIMFTIHPQRWHDNFFLWMKEIILQNIKNLVKRIIIKSTNL